MMNNDDKNLYKAGRCNIKKNYWKIMKLSIILPVCKFDAKVCCSFVIKFNSFDTIMLMIIILYLIILRFAMVINYLLKVLNIIIIYYVYRLQK